MAVTRLTRAALAMILIAGAVAAASGSAGASGDPTPVRLVRDIAPGPTHSSPRVGVTLGSVTVFNAHDGVHGFEPWVSDGSARGTSLLKDIEPGQESSGANLGVVHRGRLYFTARDENGSGNEPWVTDGTSAGTMLLADIEPGAGSSNATGFTVVGDDLYFSVWTPTSDKSGVWVTDGTRGGTHQVSAPMRGFSASTFVPLGDDRAVFRGHLPDTGSEPWITDGTAAGTHLLRDVRPGPESSTGQMASVGSSVVFAARDGSEERFDSELWRTDGTTEGTRLLKDISPGPHAGDPHGFSPVGGRLVFPGSTTDEGYELWATDGTPDGTTMIRDINPGQGDSWPNGFTSMAGKTYFAADGPDAEELWVTEGTTGTTRSVARLRTRPSGDPGRHGYEFQQPDSPTSLVATARRLYFSADTEGVGSTLWTSDGTPAGTSRVLVDGATLRGPVAAVGERLLVTGDDPRAGVELWAVDPTGFNRSTVPPVIAGSAVVGRRLSTTGGSWSRPSRLSWQWLRDGRPIGGATASSYAVRADDVGRAVSVRVTGESALDDPVTVTSKPMTGIKFSSWTRTSARRSGRTVTVTIAVGTTSPRRATGTVRITDGSRVVAKRSLSGGRTTVTLRRQSSRRHTYRVEYGGSRTITASSTSRSVSVP